MTTWEWVQNRKIIAIVRGLAPEYMLKLADALYAGGIDLMEVTFNQQKPETWKDTAAAIKAIGEHMEGKMLAGAGTVITDEQLQLVINSGGTWNEAPKVAGPKFAKDQKAVPYQTKRGMRDVLVEGAISGNIGCKVGTVLFYVALAVIVIAIVLHFVR